MRNFLVTNVNTPVTYLRAGRFIGEEGWVHADRIVDSHEIILMNEGKLYLSAGDESIEADKKTLILIPKGVRYYGTRPSPAGTSFFWFHFLLPSYEEIVEKNSLKDKLEKRYEDEPVIVLPFYSKEVNFSRLNVLLNQLMDIVMNKRNNKFYLNYFITSILMEISEETLDQEIYNNSDEKNTKMLLYIMEWIRLNLDRELTLQIIADEFNYNRSYLSRYFSSQTSYTVTEYIQKARIEKAKALLLTLPLSVEEVAASVGFKDPKYFMRCFKKIEKLTPSKFRETYRKTKFNKH